MKTYTNLGACYEYGRVVEKDLATAFNHYKTGAVTSNGRFHLGRCYHHGIGTPADRDAAIRWYTQSNAKAAKDALRKMGVR